MSNTIATESAPETLQDFASLLTSLSVSGGKPIAKPTEGPPRPSAFATPTSILVPEKLPTYTESESTRGTKRKAEVPCQKPQPDPNNPFFDARLDLKHGAGLIFKILNAAHTSSNHWTGTMVESQFLQFAQKAKQNPSHALNRICKDINHVLDLLRFGRKGWTLTDLPHNFFEDVEQLLPDIIMHLNRLSDYRGCGWLLDKVVLLVVEVEKRVKGIRKERCRIEMEAKAKGRGFWERDAQKLIKSEDPGKAMERVFGFKTARKEVVEELAKVDEEMDEEMDED
ncbi:hypothetical protein CLAFUW4_02008 [Fulvia fulva]|uniref:Uncharacterized protein n=1 Tax=Passalora fulva TaxID=5499 RepID=A0A9Q8L9B8_PASFU|nr:uncharacterized protein CLAFUR5_02001 [Fulvia fulva]KAK4635682.1 hypothetical protein CLAFUR4_02003 [Fulvia fulva]KAK4637735.1 hypothetical protein CLAFUR0_02005 [Fulvia fulva]UJO12578.1 hypothetical protein CLAFUR5_02001 [Fulvia fulva]WPV08168.1 hypothetical protein CLAFUW4_02008 [Fulvia fulva]WPV24057.1 hypothetical protein CLAFUW7_02008 [Fulvia fulva]